MTKCSAHKTFDDKTAVDMRLTTDTHSADSSPRLIINMIKVKVWTLAIAPLT